MHCNSRHHFSTCVRVLGPRTWRLGNVEARLGDLAEAFLGHLLHQHRVVPLGGHGSVSQPQERAESVHREVTLRKT